MLTAQAEARGCADWRGLGDHPAKASARQVDRRAYRSGSLAEDKHICE